MLLQGWSRERKSPGMWVAPGLIFAITLLVIGAVYVRFGLGITGVGPPRLTFQERKYDFGQVTSGANVEYRFTFANTGDRPLDVSVRQPQAISGGG